MPIPATTGWWSYSTSRRAERQQLESSIHRHLQRQSDGLQRPSPNLHQWGRHRKPDAKRGHDGAGEQQLRQGNLQIGGSLSISNSTVGNDLQITGANSFSVGPGVSIAATRRFKTFSSVRAQIKVSGACVKGNLTFQNTGTANTDRIDDWRCGKISWVGSPGTEQHHFHHDRFQHRRRQSYLPGQHGGNPWLHECR